MTLQAMGTEALVDSTAASSAAVDTASSSGCTTTGIGIMINRRHWFGTSLSTTAAAMAMLFVTPDHACADNNNNKKDTSTTLSTVITNEDKERMKIGYQQITYLLDHFEQETTICRENGGECKRDADSIRKVLGLRSTTDPLFQIDKVFNKIKNSPESDQMDGEQLDALYAATEDWTSALMMSNSMAFISQFGEYNPGGGKDEVLKYLLESQKQVLLARDALKTILEVLQVPLE